MQVVLLAGGRGTRIQEESINIPKPLVTIAGYPIIWHIMKIYEKYGHNDFIVCAGYKQELIKEYFCNYHKYNSDIKINTRLGTIDYFNTVSENFNISILNTGLLTETGGRLLQVKDYIKDDTFLLTYSDGVSDIDINKVIEFHKSHGKICTLTAVRKQGKFGILQTEDDKVVSFKEKPTEDDSWINGGFFVFDKAIFNYLLDVDLPITLEGLAQSGELMAYKHTGNWLCMDTVSDRMTLEDLCKENRAFWKVW